MLQATPAIAIPDDELHERFVLAGGPGGQNVNKVATAVELRFDAASSPSLRAAVRERLLALAGSLATRDGVIVIHARAHRSQAQNREAARRRLAELIRAAATPPKRRKPSRPSRGAVERAKQAKKRHKQRKAQRRWRPRDD